MKTILKFLIAIPLLMIGYFVVLNYGVSRAEVSECLVWQEQSQNANFYLTMGEAQQCKEHKIVVNAQIKYIPRFK